ncbi:hypothetical protein MAHJHV65_24230 [Mycobacterium avium subsp. hominissuis]|nr:VOC family protein [Mycobacterium avium subsp. hominissuis]
MTVFALRPEDFYHTGIIVPDLEAAMARLSALAGYRWITPVSYTLPFRTVSGTREVTSTFVYSLQAPHVELIQEVPGTAWAAAPGNAVHHLGYWCDDLAQSAQLLEDNGFAFEAIFWSRFADAVELIAQARELLDSSPRSSWLQYAQLDSHLGTVWRADALADLGFDSSGDPEESLQETEARQAEGLGILRGELGTPEYRRGMSKLQQAAELKVPAALAVDSVRYSIADADARARWATTIAAPILAGAFAVAWEWENTALISELVEYHSARGTFEALQRPQTGEWASTAVASVPLDTGAEPAALAAAGPPVAGGVSLTRLGPLPPLRMHPGEAPILDHYRTLAVQRYGRAVTADEPAWSTWP